MINDEIELLVAEIGHMDLEQLRELWRRRYGAPPSLRSVQIMQMQLAWRVQAEALGGIDAQTNRALARKGAVEPEGKSFGEGALLTRNWKGRRVEVKVESGGFRWNDRLYPSLSAAATAIAGSRWNGPRFFGLREAA